MKHLENYEGGGMGLLALFTACGGLVAATGLLYTIYYLFIG